MKRHVIFIIACIHILLLACKSNTGESKTQTDKEKVIREYFSGWEKKDWNRIEKNLAPGFTFTSPNNDDHLPAEKFKEKCWGQAAHIQKFNFIRFAEAGTGAYVTFQLLTVENTSFRNTEYFDFSDGKIKSIEVFFGAGEGGIGFPTNKK